MTVEKKDIYMAGNNKVLTYVMTWINHKDNNGGNA